MERLIQCLDDLEDLFFAAPLIAERLRRALKRILLMLAAVAIQVGGIILALNHPPLAFGTASLLSVALLYRAAVMPVPQAAASR